MYQILTDSCCDFTAEQYARYGVAYTPLSLICQGETLSNFSEPQAVKAFYDRLRTGVTATTSAANPESWTELMEPYLKQGQDLLVIAFTSGLSGTCQSAFMAAEELREAYPQRKILVVDSLCAALGQGMLVSRACRLRDEGMDLEAVYSWLLENRLKLRHEVTVDDLTHLKRGGRISATSALVGTMLNIKPIIHVDDEGHLINIGKVRGRKTAIDLLAKKLGDNATDRSEAFIAHGDCPEDAEYLARVLKEQYGVGSVTVGYVGPVIGAHTGPGVLALFFFAGNR